MRNNPDMSPVMRADNETEQATWYFIVGQGRSGSTLLANLLTDAVGGFHCGELQSLWEGLARDRRCTCGTKLASCAIWSPVVERVCSEMGSASLDEVLASSRRRTRQRRLLTARPSGPTDEELALRAAMERAVEEVTGATTLIDSSKTPPTMWAAAHLSRPLTVIHLVRDPRGVAHSWAKVTRDPSQKSGYMPRKKSWQSALAWDAINLTTTRLADRLQDTTWVEIRYEDFAQEPRQTLEQIIAPGPHDLSQSKPAGPEPSGSGDVGHAIGGNPRRFQQEEVRLDTRWQSAMPWSSWLACTVVTAPLLRRYGYPLRPAQVRRVPRP
jgi:hypothetical protein